MVSFDEKSVYNHINLSTDSETVCWLDIHIFGWSASPYVYQTVGMTVASYLCSLGVLNTQYIDDRMAVEASTLSKPLAPGHVNVCCLSYSMVEILTQLGYTLALYKLVVFSTTSLRHLGLTINSVKQAYLLPDVKRRSFAAIREYILKSDSVSLKTLHGFGG